MAARNCSRGCIESPIRRFSITSAVRGVFFPRGGMRQIGDELPPGAPSHWLVYFAVEDVDGASDLAAGAGAQVMLPKVNMGDSGAFAVLSDPVGAPFAVFEGRLDD